jgi:hypothetical protein
MDLPAYMLAVMVAALAIGLALAFGLNEPRPQTARGSDDPLMRVVPGHVEQECRRSERSTLLPAGWMLIALGVVATVHTWSVDIAPHGEASINAVGQRSMLHAGTLAALVIGTVLACTGHVINEIRRGR